MGSLVDTAGTVGEIHTGNDVEIRFIFSCCCDGEEVVIVADDNVVISSGKGDLIKVVGECGTVVRHYCACVVEFRPAGG